MRGYLLSLVIILLFSSLLVYTYHLLAVKRVMRDLNFQTFFVEKTAYILDDIRQDIRYLLKLDMPAGSVELLFFDKFAASGVLINKTELFNTHSEFLANFSNLTNVNINFNSVDPLEIMFSNGFVYRTNYSLSDGLPIRKIEFFNSSGGSAAVDAYELILIINDTRGAVFDPVFVGNGTLLVVNFTDINPAKSFVTSGFIDPTIKNTMTIRVRAPTEVINITVGLVDGRPNSFLMEELNLMVIENVSFNVNRSSSEALYADYNLPLNLTVGKVNFSGFVPAS